MPTTDRIENETAVLPSARAGVCLGETTEIRRHNARFILQQTNPACPSFLRFTTGTPSPVAFNTVSFLQCGFASVD
ncbi:MAG: hypothetical protein CBB71_02590 [Rhodopirellula sp. TMED11]|nr:MAG: hypothetical protein CBB71_02590 [Rhodopirellula sp. TMED11]